MDPVGEDQTATKAESLRLTIDSRLHSSQPRSLSDSCPLFLLRKDIDEKQIKRTSSVPACEQMCLRPSVFSFSAVHRIHIWNIRLTFLLP